MATKPMFTNREVFWQAAKNAQWKMALSNKTQDRVMQNPQIKFDTRNLMDIAPLLFDVSGFAEEEREQKFVEEYEKMVEAFNTPGTADPSRPDPEAIKPYVKQMYDRLVTDLDQVDWNDVKQVENMLASMKATQAIATVVNDFASFSMDFYPSHEERARIDALGARSYTVYLEGRVAMSYAGLDDIDDYVPIGFGAMKSTQMQVEAYASQALYDATLAGTDKAVLDPTQNELAEKFFLDEPFTVVNASGAGEAYVEFEYDQDRYLTDFLEAMTIGYTKTAFEQMMVSPMNSCDPVDGKKFDRSELLLIDGKPLSKIMEDLEEKGIKGSAADIEAAKLLRSALQSGTPVTAISASYDKEGKVKFHNKDVCLDLDKLNKAEYEKKHNGFRKFLDRIGIWKIKPAYPSNEERDAKLEEKKESKEYKDSVKAAEERFVKVFNSVKRPVSTHKGIVNLIPSVARVPKPDEFGREPIHDMREDMEKRYGYKSPARSVEPPIKEMEKTQETKSLLK